MDDQLGLREQTVLLTGAAGGIGRQLAAALTQAGAQVIGSDIDRGGLERLQENGIVSQILVGDLTQAATLDALLAACHEASIVINNLGTGITMRLTDTTDHDFAALFELNVLVAARIIRALAPGMVDRGQGKVINITSVLATHPVPAITAYATSKSAVIGLTRSTAIEYATHNIQINAIAPGYIQGPEKTAHFATPGGMMFAHQFLPTHQPLPPDALNGPTLFLASQLSNHITGQILVVDGGYSIW